MKRLRELPISLDAGRAAQRVVHAGHPAMCARSPRPTTTRGGRAGSHGSAAATAARAAASPGSGLAWAFGSWIVCLVLFNDVGQLFTIKVGLNLRPDRLFIPVLFLVWAVHRYWNRTRVHVHPAEWCLLVLFAWGLVSLVMAGTIHNPHNRHLSTLVSWIGLPLATLWIVRRACWSERNITIALRVLIGLGLYLAATAIFEHFEWWSLVFPRYIADRGVGLHSDRARGPFRNAAVMGGFLAMTYVTIAYYLHYIRTGWFLRALLGLTAVAVYYTYTRSAWLSFFVSFVLLGVFDARMRRQCATVLVLCALVFASGVFSKFSLTGGTLFTSRQASVEDRKNIMRAEIEMFRQRPLTGFGYGTFETDSQAYFDSAGQRSANEGNHNAFAGLIVELGLLGFVPYIASIWFLLKPGWRLSRCRDRLAPSSRGLGPLNIAVLGGYVAGIQFFDPRFFPAMNVLAFFLAGLACAADEGRVMSAPAAP